MGLTIYYDARTKDHDNLGIMVDEVTGICEILHWPYHILKDEPEIAPELLQHLQWPRRPGEVLKYTGIAFQPHPSSEWIYLTFLNGRIVMPISLQFLDLQTDPAYFWGAFTKTQFAGPETHAKIIKLLKYLESKYFEFTHFFDETEYWESGDKSRLIQAFERMDFILDGVEDILSNLKITEGKPPDDLVSKIEDALKQMHSAIYRKKM